MRVLTAEQERLADRLSLDVVPIVVITCYSARPTIDDAGEWGDRRFASWVVSKQWAFSDVAFQIGNLDVQPFLVSMSPFAQSINATPEDASVGTGLLRNFTLTLRNGISDSANRLIDDLRANDIDQADVMVGQLAIDRGPGDRETRIASQNNLGELAVFYRGFVQQVGPIDNDGIELFCNSHTPVGALGRFVLTESTTDIFLGDISSSSISVPTAYGVGIEKVPGIPWFIGFQSTLRQEIGPGDTTIILTDTITTGTPATGTLYISGEECAYTGWAVNVVTGLTRQVDPQVHHAAGESVSFVPSELGFVTAVNSSQEAQAISGSNPNYFRNVINGKITAEPTLTVIGSALTDPPPTNVGVRSYTGGQWKEILDQMVKASQVTTQATYGTVTTVPTDFTINDNAANKTQDTQYEDGDWTTTGAGQDATWLHDEGENKKRLDRIINISDLPTYSASSFTSVRVRLSVNVTDADSATKASLFARVELPWGGHMTVTSTDTELTTNGTHFVTGSEVFRTGSTIGDFAGMNYELGWFDIEGDVSSGYTAIVTAQLRFERVTISGEPLETPAAIIAAAGAAGIESYFDIDGWGTGGAKYHYPGMSLHPEDVAAGASNCTVETHTTAYAPYLFVESTAASGDMVVEIKLPAGTLDLAETGTDPGDPRVWLGYFHNKIGADLEIMVTDEVVTYPAAPTAFLTITDLNPVVNEYKERFNSQVFTGVPDLSDIRTIRVELQGIDASSWLKLWWIGPVRHVADLVGSTLDEMSHPVSILRTFLTEGHTAEEGGLEWDPNGGCGLPKSAIDEASFAAAVTSLGAGKRAAILSSDWGVGGDHVRFLLEFGRDHRFHIVSAETDACTTYRILAATTAYAWGASVATLTLYSDISELGVDAAQVFTRRTFGYKPDRSARGAGSSATWKGAYLVSAGQNDISGTVTTADITDQEALVGERIGPDFFMPSVINDADAEDIAGFYFYENLTGRTLYQVTGVPWVEGYALELNDVVTLTVPWYSATVDVRLIETVKNWRTELVDLVGVVV